ncbi:MAG TPA: thioredoxin domain-containing protein, partial [Chitinophagaceae bacterium]|nr:thioredoxin domain-containing protein [Chitinophagaceae bacterium]
MHTYTNRLINETSPYLLQHAHNPVDWFPWGEEAFKKAKEEDKPIIVSIGYAACHWCHVMERESFEDPKVAALMNENFVNIKVDREERPDVDHIYMDAVQAIEGNGGWPLNVFLTPDKKPFYGGTYFPPRQSFNRASWTEVLRAIAHSYKEGKDKIEEDAATLTEHLKKSNAFGSIGNATAVFDKKKPETAFTNIMKAADKEWGGFGKAPKFPQTFTIIFLLKYAHLTNNNEALQQAILSLDKMMQGGLYDHAGGGFARYSTDTQWLAPHFEKMLYDNALLVQAYTEAYGITKDEKYKKVVVETLAFVERELMHKDGGFYSALDADSEGVEGKFYVWDMNEVKDTIEKEADLFCQYFNITEEGNWEEKNILFVSTPLIEFAQQKNVEVAYLREVIEAGKHSLLKKRAERVR